MDVKKRPLAAIDWSIRTHTHTHEREPHNHKLISTGYIYEIELDPFFPAKKREKKKKRKKYIYNPAAAQ